MVSRKDANKARLKRHKRVRAKISGTAARPRLAVYRSNANISAQIIDDVAGKTLVSASTYGAGFEGNGGNKAAEAIMTTDTVPKAGAVKFSVKNDCEQSADVFGGDFTEFCGTVAVKFE